MVEKNGLKKNKKNIFFSKTHFLRFITNIKLVYWKKIKFRLADDSEVYASIFIYLYVHLYTNP